jgi:hypothetical protein
MIEWIEVTRTGSPPKRIGAGPNPGEYKMSLQLKGGTGHKWIEHFHSLWPQDYRRPACSPSGDVQFIVTAKTLEQQVHEIERLVGATNTFYTEDVIPKRKAEQDRKDQAQAAIEAETAEIDRIANTL